ncbi:TPA: hypothetical protein ACHOZC_003421 [Raoultella ornithinolytica]
MIRLEKEKIKELLITQTDKVYEFYIGEKTREKGKWNEDGLYFYLMKTEKTELVIFPFRLDILARLTAEIKGVHVLSVLRNSNFYRFPEPIGESNTGYMVMIEDERSLKNFVHKMRMGYRNKMIASIPNEDLSDDFQTHFKEKYNAAIDEYLKKTRK